MKMQVWADVTSEHLERITGCDTEQAQRLERVLVQNGEESQYRLSSIKCELERSCPTFTTTPFNRT